MLIVVTLISIAAALFSPPPPAVQKSKLNFTIMEDNPERWRPAPTATNFSGTSMRKSFTKNSVFQLPIQFADDATRARIRETKLYVKIGSGRWNLHESLTSEKPHFIYRAPAEGEYWFSLATVDQNGKQSPEDIEAAPPALRVVIDTTPPKLETSLIQHGGEQLLHVRILDANPDSNSVTATVATEDGFRNLELSPDGIGFRLLPGDRESTIRIAGSDRSGNRTYAAILASELPVVPIAVGSESACLNMSANRRGFSIRR